MLLCIYCEICLSYKHLVYISQVISIVWSDQSKIVARFILKLCRGVLIILAWSESYCMELLKPTTEIKYCYILNL